MPYKPTFPGDQITPQWIFDELNRIAAEFGRVHTMQFDKIAVAPAKPREGMLALANGANWNPTGSISSSTAAGLAIYLEGTWQRLLNGGHWMANVKTDYGAVGDGVADDTAKIQAALNSTTDKIIYFPEGDYLVTGSLTCSVQGKTIFGANPLSTRIISNQSAGDVLTSTGQFFTVRDMQFTNSAAVSRSAGYYLALDGSQATAEHVFMTSFFGGIRTASAVNRILDCELRDGKAGGTCIYVTGGDTSQTIDNCLIDSVNSLHGIFTDNNAALIVANSSVIGADNCLTLAPGSGQSVFSNKFINCFFDTAVNGIRINPSATAGVYRSQFVNCWSSSHTEYGVQIVATGASTVDGIDFISHEAHLNTLDGVLLTGSNVANIQFSDCKFCDNNGAGLSINNHTTKVKVSHCHFGDGYGLGDNTNQDIWIGTSVSAISILDCTLNSTTPITLNTDQHIARNRGYNTKAQGRASITAAATQVVVSTGLSRSFTFGEVTVTPITGWAAATEFWVSSISGSTMVINVDAAPGVEINFAWTVDTEDRNL